MYVYLVQHGKPRSKEEDPDRSLSEEGLRDVEKTAHYVSSIKVGRICHSGKLRAAQTADVFGRRLGAKVSEKDGLAPLDDPDVWADRMARSEEDTMLVGHLPHLQELASLLLSGDRKAGIVEFRMGGIVCLKKDNEAGKWSLQWMLVPDRLN
jgi:phosphohistidine phosphatase